MQTPIQVLVVDDDRDAAEALTELLQMHSAETVHTGRDALDAARRIRPNLILLDIWVAWDGWQPGGDFAPQ